MQYRFASNIISGLIKYKEIVEIKMKYEEYIGKNKYFNISF